MGKARDLARIIVNSSGAIDATNLGNAIPADGSITTAKLANSAVTDAKIAAMAATKLTGQVADANAPSGSVIQVVNKLYTDVFTTTGSQTTRIPVTDFYVDITPISSSSKILIIVNLSVGFSSTPEWSWFVDRTIGGTTTQVGNATYVGNRMNGYHGGPQDTDSEVDELFSYSHNTLDSPSTTSSIRYQVCMQDRWVNYTAKYINRTGNDQNTGFTTRGSSALTVMEIAA